MTIVKPDTETVYDPETGEAVEKVKRDLFKKQGIGTYPESQPSTVDPTIELTTVDVDLSVGSYLIHGFEGNAYAVSQLYRPCKTARAIVRGKYYFTIDNIKRPYPSIPLSVLNHSPYPWPWVDEKYRDRIPIRVLPHVDINAEAYAFCEGSVTGVEPLSAEWSLRVIYSFKDTNNKSIGEPPRMDYVPFYEETDKGQHNQRTLLMGTADRNKPGKENAWYPVELRPKGVLVEDKQTKEKRTEKRLELHYPPGVIFLDASGANPTFSKTIMIPETTKKLKLELELEVVASCQSFGDNALPERAGARFGFNNPGQYVSIAEISWDYAWIDEPFHRFFGQFWHEDEGGYFSFPEDHPALVGSERLFKVTTLKESSDAVEALWGNIHRMMGTSFEDIPVFY